MPTTKEPSAKQINALRFDCITDVTEEEVLSGKYPQANKLKVNRNGKLIVADPLWLDQMMALPSLLDTDPAAKNRLQILSKKTQRAYGGDYTQSHSITTLNSVYSLLLSMPVKAAADKWQIEAIRELSILVAVTKLKEKEESDALRAGNVTFVDESTDAVTH